MNALPFDPLEQTQDIAVIYGPGVWSHGAGVWRRAWPDVFYRHAPELSVRYPSIYVRLTVRQAS